MKNIKTFEEFLNEGKYDNTWFPDIQDAMYADQRDKKAGGSGYAKRRDLAMYIDPDRDWSKATDKDIVKYINDLKKSIVDEQKNKAMWTKIETELERLNATNGIRIYAHAACSPDRRIKFVRPCLLNGDTSLANYQMVLDFLTKTHEITCNAHPTVVNRFEVEYSGTVVNDRGETIEYAKVNNGMAVVPG